MIRSFLAVLAMLIGTTAGAQGALPKFVQGLSDENYATWASWQNRQVKLRAAEEAKNSYEEPYVYAVKTTTSVKGGVVSALRQLDKTHRSKYSATRRAVVTRDQSDWRNIASETRQHWYANPTYTPPGPVTIHNPYARFASPVAGRVPNWNKIFLPCKTGTMTVAEMLEKIRAPVSAERLFSLVMSEWLGK